jgi:hypothetical protein
VKGGCVEKNVEMLRRNAEFNGEEYKAVTIIKGGLFYESVYCGNKSDEDWYYKLK